MGAFWGARKAGWIKEGKFKGNLSTKQWDELEKWGAQYGYSPWPGRKPKLSIFNGNLSGKQAKIRDAIIASNPRQNPFKVLGPND